jgi:subtilase family serine protease
MTRTRLVAIVVALLTAGASFVSLPGVARGEGAGGPRQRPSCERARPRFARCFAEVVTEADGATPDASTSPDGGRWPGGLRQAYKLPTTGGSGKTVAVVDAYDNPNAESDLGAYRSRFGLPACTTANGCFRKVNQSGAASPLPSGSIGWGQEIAIDLDMASAVCPNCKLLLVEANSNSLDDLAAAVDRAATMGADAISNSWGSSEFSDETSFERHFNHSGRAITASSGDDGYGVAYPAASKYVTAVGGTRLTRNANVVRKWTETAWSGAGSGCSAYIAKPSWQTDTGCSRRTVADVAAVADPSTGVSVYDSYGSSGGRNWYVFGGTSVGAPIIAALYVLAGNSASISDGRYPYAHRSSLFDIKSGSNGSCSPAYLCQSVTGYDGPTGLGTPNGVGAF